MRKIVALLLVLHLFSGTINAQADTIDIVFGYLDSTKITVNIMSEDATKEPKHIFLAGIGTVGPFESNALATHFKYAFQLNKNIGLDARWSKSIQNSDTKGIQEIGVMAHVSLLSKENKTDMGLKLMDVKTETNKREYKQPYFASYPFKVRHQVLLDLGLSHVSNRAEVKMYSQNSPDTNFVGSDFSSLNLVVGASYSRVRSVKLKINKLAHSYYFSKFKVGMNVGYNLSNKSSFLLCSNDTLCTTISADELPNMDFKKVGVGFDINYTFSSAHPKWLMAIDLQGRFSPFYQGESHRYDNGSYGFNPTYQYTSKLVLMPRFSVGYIL